MRRTLTAAFAAAALAVPSSTAAQLVSAGLGPAFPTSEFKSQVNPGTGLSLFARVSLPVMPLLLLQLEAMQTTWRYDVGGLPRDLTILQPGAVVVLHLVDLGRVRPFVLGGLAFSRQRHSGTGGSDDTAWRFGYQAGFGADFRAGPVTPFVELRWVSLDAPGSVRFTFVPLLVGLRVL